MGESESNVARVDKGTTIDQKRKETTNKRGKGSPMEAVAVGLRKNDEGKQMQRRTRKQKGICSNI